MTGPQQLELYWLKFGAIAQAAGAAATFLAVLVSLYIAFRVRKPRLRLRAYAGRLIGEDPAQDLSLATFSVVNAGERPVYVRGVGWRTGWLRWGPKFLRRQSAVQITGGGGIGQDPPYEIQAGGEVSSHALLDNLIQYSEERKTDPFYTRDWPLGLGRRGTRIRAYVYTADGHYLRAKPDKSLLTKLIAAERRALEAPGAPNGPQPPNNPAA
jgi:hypothetical protein